MRSKIGVEPVGRRCDSLFLEDPYIQIRLGRPASMAADLEKKLLLLNRPWGGTQVGL